MNKPYVSETTLFIALAIGLLVIASIVLTSDFYVFSWAILVTGGASYIERQKTNTERGVSR